jgi:adenosylmethionine-8-amino-7-oxononanoate aminotransferase
MTSTSTGLSPEELQKAARDHLWLHFTRMGGYADGEVPIIVRGDGCYLEDSNGKRYLDALAGLFSVNIGYGYGEEIGQAALEQMRELPFYTNWSYAHPRAIELAAEVASLAPGDLNRVFFVSGGSEAVESAWKLARQYYLARGERVHRGIVTPGARAGAQEAETMHDAIVVGWATAPRRYKAIARRIAYHGTTMGALAINGIPAIRVPFEPLVPEVRHVANTNRYHRPPDETEEQFTTYLLDELEETILAMGPETVCLIHMEPVQNAGGAFTPPKGYWQGVRELCDRYDILLSADEVITAFGRLGYWFGSERYDIRPDIVCCAKGLSSSYAAIGAVIATDRVMEPFLEDTSMYSHGITFGGHPVMSAIALKNIEIMKRDRIVENVLENEEAFHATLAQLLELPIVGDLRGTGFFYALELVKDKETRETFSDEECERLLRGFLTPRMFEAGLICRADDRGDPVIQISPPLVAGQAEFDELVGILGDVLQEAWQRI